MDMILPTPCFPKPAMSYSEEHEDQVKTNYTLKTPKHLYLRRSLCRCILYAVSTYIDLDLLRTYTFTTCSVSWTPSATAASLTFS